MSAFAQRLHARVKKCGTPALVGIDPRLELIPPDVIASANARAEKNGTSVCAEAFEEFSMRLVDVVAPLVPAVKPQAAFFEEIGPAGSAVLQRVMAYAREQGLVVICDAKRGDIGSTAAAYARGYLAGSDPHAAPWAADALTVNPYLGADTLEPFVKVARERGGGIYVLVRTSNPGAGSFQDRKTDGEMLFEHVATHVEGLARDTAGEGDYGCVGAVVGATWPQELVRLREAMPHAPLLVPGYGSQGGSAQDVLAAVDSDGCGALINSSRGINFAWQRDPYRSSHSPDKWEAATEQAVHDMIADLSGTTV